MGETKSRRRFGSVRKLPSGKFQASYIDPNGNRQNAPMTFTRKRDAEVWLSRMESDISRGEWHDPRPGLSTVFGEYAKEYLRNPDIGERWRETCLRNLRLHLAPLVKRSLIEITPAVVRHWYNDALAGDGGGVSIAQSYRYLRAVMNQAVNDEVIKRNPCRIPGAGADKASERPIATPEQIDQLADAITPRYRVAVLLAAWCGVRRGEITALTHDDLDLDAEQVTVRHNHVELLESPLRFDKDPKSPAGRRTIGIPPHIIPDLRKHLDEWAGRERVFVGRDGSPMRGDAIRQAFERARERVGMEWLRFHDLRHTGQTLAASTGATMKDLMKRLGHSSDAAAKRYLHAVEGRDGEIAKALSDLNRDGSAAKLPRHINTS